MTERLDFSHEPSLTIDELVQRVQSYYPEVDDQLLRKAYDFSAQAHSQQKRSSGEPYIIHPLNVAGTLAKLKMDLDTIMVGLLHDVVEDCQVTVQELELAFGKSVAEIVLGLTKISKIEFKSKEESQAENFRKMIVAMARDIRVIIVKLADRMHNIRTLQYVSVVKQQRVAQETLDIYVPLAMKLGIHSVKSELEDLCLRFLHPDIYYRLAEKIAKKRSERDHYITDTIQLVQEKFEEYAIKAEVTGRSKNFYSIYKKMQHRGVDFEQVQDLLAFRVIVSSITDCYKVLGVIHSSFIPIPGRFKDYVAIPKINNYQSLHTTVIGPKAERIEIQIRTQEMHEVAERGVAAHWKYKERGSQPLTAKELAWVNDLLEANQSVKSNSEFMDVVKSDLDFGGIFIFTPKGDVKELAPGSGPLDFAYAVHTEVGNHCIGAKVNGKMVPLKYRLKSGDTIDIITSKTQFPSKDWLKIVKTSRARTKIKQYITKIERDKLRELGEQMFDKSLSLYGTSSKVLDKKGELKKCYELFNAKHLEELYIHLAAGVCSLKEVLKNIPYVGKLEEKDSKQEQIEGLSQSLRTEAKQKSGRDNAIIVDGLGDVQVRIGKCCSPIPGDPIIGHVTRGRGISVHTKNCKRHQGGLDLRLVTVDWNKNYQFKYPVSIKVMTQDRPGILAQISKTINNMGINIRSAMAKSLPDQKGDFLFEVEVKDFSDLIRITSTLESLDEVISVERT